MPIDRFGRESGVGAGLSSWLDRLVQFVNGIEAEVRGAPGIERQIAGRQDELAVTLRRQIEELRRLQAQEAAGLRGRLDSETQARIDAVRAADADLRSQIAALASRVSALESGGEDG